MTCGLSWAMVKTSSSVTWAVTTSQCHTWSRAARSDRGLSAGVRQQVVSRTATVVEEGVKLLVKDLLPAAAAMAAVAALTNQSAR